MKCIKSLVLTTFLFLSITTFGQQVSSPVLNDSAQIIMPRMMGYSIKALQIRTAIGWQGNPNIELGWQKSSYAIGCGGIAGLNYYAGSGFFYSINQNEQNRFVMNPKVGADLMIMFLSFGGQLNYYSDFENHAFGFSLTLSLWLDNQWKIQYVENLTFGNSDVLNIGNRGVMLIYGINLKKKDSQEEWEKRFKKK
ncbi:MAG: hypothetical protein ACPG19_03810 [Saprospiraceae bacterium]